jgi:uncharacterized protein DUF4397
MNLFKVCGTGLLAAVAAGCWSHDTGGFVPTPDAVAGLRYINLVSDTFALNFRVVDVINNAPNSINAVFRTGGNPYGVTTAFLPPYMPVDAGTRHIKVFLYSTVDTIATQVVLDTNYTFVVNTNYTFYLYRNPTTTKVEALITTDAVPTIPAGKVAVRVLNLAPDLAGNYGGASPTVLVDSRIAQTNSAVPLPGSNVATNTAFLGIGSYTVIDTNQNTFPYRLTVTTSGTTTPILFQAVMPTGTRGTSTLNPIGGTYVVGTAMTAIIVPRSKPGSPAPQGAPAQVSTNIDSLTRSNDTATVWRHITPGNGTTTCNAAVGAGAAVNDLLNVTGLTQPEYNGSQAVISITAGASQTPQFRQIVTLAGGVAGNTFRLVVVSGDTTLPIAYDAPAGAVRSALAADTLVGDTTNVTVAGPAGGPFTVVFVGKFASTSPRPLMTATSTAPLTVTVAPDLLCLGTATSSRFRYRVAGAPATPATGAMSYRNVTAGNDYTAPWILFALDNRPPQTAP